MVLLITQTSVVEREILYTLEAINNTTQESMALTPRNFCSFGGKSTQTKFVGINLGVQHLVDF